MIGLRWYQELAVNSIFEYFASNQGNPVVAMPTGTGKSWVIGGFIQRALFQFPFTRVMMLTHVKELIEQNADKLLQMWPGAPIGIYSAGIGKKQSDQPITFGGVQSVRNNVAAFGHIDLLLIDECHLLSDNADTVYQQVIDQLKLVNPWLKVIGLSATPYRMGLGKITENGIFTHTCVDMTSIEWFARFIAEGHMVPLIPKRTQTQLDVSSVGMSNGDFNLSQLQQSVDVDEITYAALNELVQLGYNRRSWVVFASGIDHAEHIAASLQYFGIEAAAIHSKIGEEERDRRTKAWQAGTLRCAVTNNMLTTGVDHPYLDLIGMMRPTMSTALWVQMLGRGTRPAPGKSDCLVLDFARNTVRLGPINDPVLPRRKGAGGGDAPVRICENCGTYNHASARICVECGIEFEFETKIVRSAGLDELLRSDLPVTEYFDVQNVIYSRHISRTQPTNPPMMKVSYQCGLRQFSEYVCLEHPGFPGKRARDWWRQRHYSEPPLTTDEALQYMTELRAPRRIHVWINKKYPEVLGSEF